MTDKTAIQTARRRGFAGYFAATPNSDTQDVRTANAARHWLQCAPVDCERCKVGSAHDHPGHRTIAGELPTE